MKRSSEKQLRRVAPYALATRCPALTIWWYALPGTDVGYGATRCPVLMQDVVLCARYALSSTDVCYGCCVFAPRCPERRARELTQIADRLCAYVIMRTEEREAEEKGKGGEGKEGEGKGEKGEEEEGGGEEERSKEEEERQLQGMGA
eukprot:3092228-Rhodomonas_salina.4